MPRPKCLPCSGPDVRPTSGREEEAGPAIADLAGGPSERCPSTLAGDDSASIGFVLFGDGPLHDVLARRIVARALEKRFVLAGFHGDIDRYFPHLDLFVQSSFTEGLASVILEAQAAGVPVVATSVGGTPEVIEDGRNGWLVPPGDAAVLAKRIAELLADDSRRAAFSREGRADIAARFTFAARSRSYRELLAAVLGHSPDAPSAAFPDRQAAEAS